MVIIKSLTKFQQGAFPLTYFGCPLFVDRPNRRIFDPFLSKMNGKIEGWKGKFLSYGGKLILLKSVLQAIPIYYIFFMDPSSTTIHDFKILMANFFWLDSEGTHKHHWINWGVCFFPQDEGALGLRNFKDIAKAFSFKL